MVVERRLTVEEIFDPVRHAAAMQLPVDLGPEFPAPHTLTDEEVEANYLGGFMVRDGGEIRPLRMTEMGGVDRLKAKRALDEFRANGCCGCRAANGLCTAQNVSVELWEARRAAGMKTGTLRAIGDLCPHSELWAAWEVTRDTGAIAEVLDSNWEGD